MARRRGGGRGSFDFEFRGNRKLQSAINRWGDQLKDRVPGALFEEGERIMTISKQNFVPVKDGVLRASGRTHPAVRKGKNVEVVLSFGGTAVTYALEQHENLDFSHTVGEAKYLERPLNAAIPGMINRLAKRLKI